MFLHICTSLYRFNCPGRGGHSLQEEGNRSEPKNTNGTMELSKMPPADSDV